MQVKFFCPRWGAESISWEAFAIKVKEAGFDGVEGSLPFDEREKNEIITSLKKYNLLFLGQYFQSFEKDFSAHRSNFEKHLRNLAGANPVAIDSQTGKDYYSFEQNKELFDLAAQVSKETGVPIYHETHRNKALFAAHSSGDILTRIPALQITADFSHWCCVAESYLEDQQEAVTLACSRAAHIHARVGHPEGPQVNDPRAPEWKTALDAHLQWWDAIIDYRRKAGANITTITPEFGPAPGYMPTIPYTQAPVADQWDINVYMMNLLRQRYADKK